MKLSDKLRNAANRTTRLNADVAILCEAALQAADAIDASGWQPIDTLPERMCVDLWIKSEDNETYGRRAPDGCVVDGIYHGNNPPDRTYGEYASHWRRQVRPE